MLPTTHIAASCLLTAYTLDSGVGTFPQLIVLSGGALLVHYALDIVPHGYIALPDTIFKKLIPTILETVPGPLILLASILIFGNPLLFILAAFFGMIPDLFTTLYVSNRGLAEKIPFAVSIHRLHRKLHWFEEDHGNGRYTFMFPKNPLLAGEVLLLAGLLAGLFLGMC